MIRENKVKSMLRNGKKVVGTFVKMNDPASVEIFGLLGFDFIVVDNEHVAMNKDDIFNLIRGAEVTGIVPIVRVGNNTSIEVLQALDAGALGVQVPNIDTKKDIIKLIKNAKYAPLGNRGFSPSNRSAAYGIIDKEKYVKQANENTLIVCHCESGTSVNNLDEILLEEELDVIFIGPMDLSQSLGIIGQVNHPRLLKNVDKIIKKVLAMNKVVGMVAPNAKKAKELLEKGVQYIVISSDQGMLVSMGREYIKEIRE